MSTITKAPGVVATVDAANATATIAPFDTGLNGVNQTDNMLFKDALWWTLGIFALMVLLVRMLQITQSHLRHVSAMSSSSSSSTQGYWKMAQWRWMPALKKHLIYSPLWKKRHNREAKLSTAVSIGTLPSRLHFIILAIYLFSNFVYMLYLDWSRANRYSLVAEIRGRSGTLAAVNMVPLIILAGRNNPLIHILKISFDTYNLLHRWMGRMIVLEALIHGFAWTYVQVSAEGWGSLNEKLLHETFCASGFAGLLALNLIFFLSLGPIRHAFYETFLNTHILLAFIVFVMTWVHCASANIVGGLPQLPWVVSVLMIWFMDRLARMLRLAYNNWTSNGFTDALIEPMPGDTTRVTMHLPRYIDVKPGTHAYVRFKSVNPWESHPFSIAWVEHHPEEPDKTVASEKKRRSAADFHKGTTSVSFVIGAHTGFTRKLYNTACKGGFKSMHLKAAMEGPYAGHHSLDSYGTAVLFAGATGITHQLSYLKPLIQGFNDGSVATRRITLVWIMRDTESLEWVRPWMDEVLRLPRRRDVLNIRLFVTRPKNTKEIHSASSTVQMFPGRPNVQTLLAKEQEDQVGAMCVTVCGPGALADDVRQAVRMLQDENSVIDFVEESFTW